MSGLLTALFILIGIWISFCVVYKKETGRNMIKDLYNDLFGK